MYLRAQVMIARYGDMFVHGYTTMRDAKRGAERFLKRLQETVK